MKERESEGWFVQARVEEARTRSAVIVIVGFSCVNSTTRSKQDSIQHNMADLVSYLLSDPSVDDNGVPLDDRKCDASVRRLVDYMRKLKAQDVPQQVQGKPLTEVSRCHLLCPAHV